MEMQKNNIVLRKRDAYVYINISGAVLGSMNVMCINNVSRLVPGKALDGDDKGIEKDQEPKQDQSHIRDLAPLGLLGEGTQVEQGREDEQQRSAGNGSNKRDEDIQVGVSCIGYHCNSKVNQNADNVLLQQPCLGPGAITHYMEDTSLNDSDAWEQHQWRGQKDGNDVQDLDGVLAGFLAAGAVGQVVEHDSLDGVTIGSISQTSETDQQSTDGREHNGQCAGELLGVGHAAANGDDHADTLVGKDGSTDKEAEVLLVEELQCRGGTLVDDQLLNIISVEIDQTDNNAQIRDQGTGTELGDVADQGEGDQDNKEDGDPHNLVKMGAAQTGDHDRELLGHENAVTAGK